MTRHPPALLGFGLALLASPSWGLANATLTKTLHSADPACDQPNYSFSGTADFTTNDDGAGQDWYALVYHDASGNYHDVDFGTVEAAADPISGADSFLSSLPFASFFGSRPLVVRVHDIPAPGAIGENTKQGLEFASAAPVVFELRFDPAADAAACSAKPSLDHSLRIESLKNGGGQTVTSSTPLNLDGLGATALTVAAPERSMLVALFRAECANSAANNTSWATVDIQVDGVALAPTAGTSDALCTSNGVAGNGEWVMARTSGARAVSGPGVHTVSVRGESVGGTSSFFDTELVVMVPEPLGWQLRAAGLAALVLLAWRRRSAERARSAPRSRGLPTCAALAALAVGTWASAPARADTVLERTSNGTSQSFAASAGPTLLNLGGGTSFALDLARPARVAILFTAECAIDAVGDQTWLDLDIRVDGVAVPQSDDSDDSFCTSTGATPGILDDWVSAGHHVTIDLAAGLHSIQVQGQLQSTVGTDQWRIDDLALTVIGQEH